MCSGGTWTTWLDRDSPSGLGDYETLGPLVSEGLGCLNPLAIECKTLGGVDWTLTGEVYHCNVTEGGYCVNSEQPDGSCLDYHVRLLCP
jgi:hypothetical protein